MITRIAPVSPVLPLAATPMPSLGASGLALLVPALTAFGLLSLRQRRS